MSEEHGIGWYEPSSPLNFEVITDHTGWRPIASPQVTGSLPCYSGTVESEPGYLRARTLFGDSPETFGTASNILTLPEPAWVGLALGVMLLARWGRRGRVY